LYRSWKHLSLFIPSYRTLPALTKDSIGHMATITVVPSTQIVQAHPDEAGESDDAIMDQKRLKATDSHSSSESSLAEDHEDGNSTPRATTVEAEGDVDGPSLEAQLDAVPEDCKGENCKCCAIYRPRWFRDESSNDKDGEGLPEERQHQDSIQKTSAQTSSYPTFRDPSTNTSHTDPSHPSQDEAHYESDTNLSISLSGKEGSIDGNKHEQEDSDADEGEIQQ
jgi:hypothetical protein